MTVAFVQRVTGSGAVVNAQSYTLNGVAAGALLVNCNSLDGDQENATPSDDRGNTWNTTTEVTPQSCEAYINYAQNASAGNTVVTVDYGTGFYIEGSLAEFSGVATSGALDQQASNSNAGSATPTSGTTGATTEADSLVVACLACAGNTNDQGIDTPAATGFSNLHVHQSYFDTIGHSSDYKVVAATGAQSASWGTMNGSYPWAAKIATFKGAGAASPVALEHSEWPLSLRGAHGGQMTVSVWG
jgi:hypothetical protein